MKINNPTNKRYELNANILLGYHGQNLALANRKTYKPAKLNFLLDEYLKGNGDFIFEIDFIQFQDENLKLNFNDMSVEQIRGKIGTVDLLNICLEDSQMIISGSYQHNTINLAWHNEDEVYFDCIVDLKDKKGKEFIENLIKFKIKYPVIGDKIIEFTKS